MELQEILSQIDGFTPPSVTVQIEKVFPYKKGEGEKGPWSFQSVKVNGGELKLKNLDPFPDDRVGETVTLRAYPSKQHGLTGMKVAHEEYQGKTYDKLVITPTCIWEWAEPNKASSNGHKSNGNGTAPKEYTVQRDKAREFNLESHLSECARIANGLIETLGLTDDSARQACFATVCIDAQRHNVILGEEKPTEMSADKGSRDALIEGVKSACKLLNSEGYEPAFNPATLDRYINHEFQVTGGLQNLSTDNVELLIKSLSDLLDSFRLDRSLEQEPDDEGADF